MTLMSPLVTGVHHHKGLQARGKWGGVLWFVVVQVYSIQVYSNRNANLKRIEIYWYNLTSFTQQASETV